MNILASAEWIIAAPLINLAAVAEANKVDWKVIFAKYGLSPAILEAPEAKISVRSTLALFNAVTKSIGQEGVILDTFHQAAIGHGNVFDYVGLYAETVRDSLVNWVRFHPTRTNTLRLTLSEDDSGAILEWSVPEHLGPIGPFAYTFIPLIFGRMESLLGDEANQIRLEFATIPPKGPSTFLARNSARIAFGKPANRLLVPKTLLTLRPQTADPALLEIVEKAAQQMLEADNQVPTPIARISACISARLKSGDCTMSSVSEDIGLSKRALQNVLDQAGTSFRDLQATVRRSVVEHYLVDTNLPLKEIAYLSGFSEISGFSRAVRKWFGKPPRALRQEVQRFTDPSD